MTVPLVRGIWMVFSLEYQLYSCTVIATKQHETLPPLVRFCTANNLVRPEKGEAELKTKSGDTVELTQHTVTNIKL